MHFIIKILRTALNENKLILIVFLIIGCNEFACILVKKALNNDNVF